MTGQEPSRFPPEEPLMEPIPFGSSIDIRKCAKIRKE